MVMDLPLSTLTKQLIVTSDLLPSILAKQILEAKDLSLGILIEQVSITKDFSFSTLIKQGLVLRIKSPFLTGLNPMYSATQPYGIPSPLKT